MVKKNKKVVEKKEVLMKKEIDKKKKNKLKSPINSSGDNFIYANFKKAVGDLKLIKVYFIFSLIVFLIVTLMGAFFPVFFVDEIIELLRQIIAQTEGLGPWELTRFIMANNIQSSFFAMSLGVLFGVVPLIVAVVNAYVLGFVINQSVSAEGIWIVWRLFPHGIFEIPAILISISLGLRLGMFLFFWLDSDNGNEDVEMWSEFKKWVVQSLRIFLLVVIPLLMVAGIVEGMLIWVVG